MATDWISIGTLLVGSGAIVSIATLLYNWRASLAQQDFQARQNGKEYYLKMYAHVNILFELAESYVRARRPESGGKTAGFTFKKCGFIERTASEILSEFKESYRKFNLFYIENKRDGNEMFISAKFGDCLANFWRLAMEFDAAIETMEEDKRSMFMTKFRMAFEETTRRMQKLYGLK